MIRDGDIHAAHDLRALMEPAQSGDRAAAEQLRRAERHVRKRLDQAPTVWALAAWLAEHGLPDDAAAEVMDTGLPLLSLELGRRRAAFAARPAAPSPDQVIEAAHAADAGMLAAVKKAKTVCRKVINELGLTEVPTLGTVVEVGRRRLRLVQVSDVGRLTWQDIDRPARFTSGRTGRLRPVKL